MGLGVGLAHLKGSNVYSFFPPTIQEGPAGGNWLFARYKLTRGISVLKIDGIYYEMRYPTQDDIAEADIFYQGGHEYTVSDSEAVDLQNAGYTVAAL